MYKIELSEAILLKANATTLRLSEANTANAEL
jgi:hypothetical protein